MKKIKFNELFKNFPEFSKPALEEKIFIHPTDTIYGIGAVATPDSTKKIYEIKRRDQEKPFSLIAPDMEWIRENFIVSRNFEKEVNEFLENNHGITLLLKKRHLSFLNFISTGKKLGVRLLKHPFQKFVSYLRKPFITTSANISGDEVISSVDELPEEIYEEINFIIDGGKLVGQPSKIIDYTNKKIIER